MLPKVAVAVWVCVVRRGVALLGSSLHREAAPESPVVGFVTGCHPPGAAPRRVEVAAVCDAEVLMHVLREEGGERAVLWMRRPGGNNAVFRAVYVVLHID